MTQALVASQSNAPAVKTAIKREEQYVTMSIAGQSLGISVLAVQDIIRPRAITSIPLAPPEVAGVLNLRGRIVTAIDLRVRLGLPPQPDKNRCMSIVVPHEDELFCFLVDKVGDVLTLPLSSFEACPANMEKSWREVASGVYSLENKLMVVLDVERLLTFAPV